jgi:para-nitrobenzyl esterase
MKQGSNRIVTMLLLVCPLAAAACSGGDKPERKKADPSSRRETPSGTLVGFTDRYGSHAYLGIPYARPPIGELRWKVPQSAEGWKGTREALELGPPCPQLAHPFGVHYEEPDTPVGKEDCLYLNIYAPRFPPGEIPKDDARLPVMVWIHGGGNTIGYAGLYHGGNLASKQKVVVVTINYRLGPFGWFRHAALRPNGDPVESSGNFGTLDIIRSLEWVRDNISAFGGDPSRVTIFGESAGARNVVSLLVSPLARGLFHRAISQSGSTRLQWADGGERFREKGGHANSSNEALLRLLVADGKTTDRGGARTALKKMEPAAVAAYLRKKSVVELLDVYRKNRHGGLPRVPNVFADGHVIPNRKVIELLKRPDGFHKVPVMLGTNRDENKTFMLYDERRVRKFFGLPARLRNPNRYNATASALARLWKADAADLPAAAIITVHPRVFVYRWDWDEQPSIWGADLSVMLGAAHGLEIPFVFGHFDLGKQANMMFTGDNEKGRQELSERMMSYWAEFAYTGDPGRGRDGDLPRWKAWDGSGPHAAKYMILDTEEGGGLRMSSRTYTVQKVVKQVDRDKRLRNQRDRCGVFREMARWSHLFSKADYVSAGKNGCKAFPYDNFKLDD